MTDGVITVANGTDAEYLEYSIWGTGSGYTVVSSGVLGNSGSGVASENCNVSGFSSYNVAFGRVGSGSGSGSVATVTEVMPGQTVLLAVDVDVSTE